MSTVGAGRKNVLGEQGGPGGVGCVKDADLGRKSQTFVRKKFLCPRVNGQELDGSKVYYGEMRVSPIHQKPQGKKKSSVNRVKAGAWILRDQ